MKVEGKEYPIVAKPRWVHPLPGIGTKTCQAFLGKIWVPRWIYADLESEHPSPWSVAIVLHEQEHLNEYKKHGPIKHFFLYAFSRKFRFEAELIACKPQMAYLKKEGVEYHFDHKACLLSSWLYLWCVDYATAMKGLRRVWEEV